MNTFSFEKFFEGWLVRQEHYLDELLTAEKNCHESREEDLREMISRVLSHYQQYYEQKSIAAQHNVFLLLSPPWFSSLEKSFLWTAGFKPGLAFRLVNNSVLDMTSDQSERMRRVAEETRAEERSLANELAKIQESVAAPSLLKVVRREGRKIDGNYLQEEHVAIESLRSALETVVGNADSLRSMTAAKVAEILTPSQNVRFFLAVTQLQVNIRRLGLRRDAEQRQEGCSGSGWYS